MWTPCSARCDSGSCDPGSNRHQIHPLNKLWNIREMGGYQGVTKRCRLSWLANIEPPYMVAQLSVGRRVAELKGYGWLSW
jgi:hypothetical protein